jgi:hypothetical protein
MSSSSVLRAASLVAALAAASAFAKPPAGCELLPDHAKIKAALQAVVKEGADANSGFGLHMWAATVNRDGVVCNIAFSGEDRGAQWPGSRLIAAEKANTANSFSLPGLALSTANLFAATQTGQSLYGLHVTQPGNPDALYSGSPDQFGTPTDPMIGKRVGGIVAFGGGFGLYDSKGKLVGGVGVSGDTACADHVIGWKLRKALALDFVPGGVAADKSDNLILDMKGGASAGGFGHPTCGGKSPDAIIQKLPEAQPLSKKAM